MDNGWRSFRESSPYDQFGSIREKDRKTGLLPFAFVAVSSINKPVFLGLPEIISYIYVDTMVPNTIFVNDSIKVVPKLVAIMQAYYNNDDQYTRINFLSSLQDLLELLKYESYSKGISKQ